MKQNKEHLPVYGVGPIYGVVVILLTITVCVAANIGIIDSFKIPDTSLTFTIIGILAIIIGVVVWLSAAISIDKYIKNNKLCTEGIYEWVRNPCYSGIMFICTGAIMSVIIIIVSINTGFEASKLKYVWELLIGSVLLIVFGGLLFIKYKK